MSSRKVEMKDRSRGSSVNPTRVSEGGNSENVGEEILKQKWGIQVAKLKKGMSSNFQRRIMWKRALTFSGGISECQGQRQKSLNMRKMDEGTVMKLDSDEWLWCPGYRKAVG